MFLSDNPSSQACETIGCFHRTIMNSIERFIYIWKKSHPAQGSKCAVLKIGSVRFKASHKYMSFLSKGSLSCTENAFL